MRREKILNEKQDKELPRSFCTGMCLRLFCLKNQEKLDKEHGVVEEEKKRRV